MLTITKTIRDSVTMRWAALLLLSLAMFGAYFFLDILSPILDLLLKNRSWSNTAYGCYQSASAFLNVFLFGLIFAGVILDKFGVRRTAILSGLIMLLGACIEWYAVSDSFTSSGLEAWLIENLNYIPGFQELGVSPFYDGMPASAKLAAIGMMLFGFGSEMSGIMVTRGILKWFTGRDMPLAMGSQVALSRLGVATCVVSSPFLAKSCGEISVSRPVAFGVVLMLIAVIMLIVYFFMDSKLEMQIGKEEHKEEFRIHDLGKILSSGSFWIIALLCVLYYSAIFPFQKYAVNMLQCNLTFTEVQAESFWASQTMVFIQYGLMLMIAVTSFASNFMEQKKWEYILTTLSVIFLIAYCYMGYCRQSAEAVFAVFPLLALAITPRLGKIVGEKGKIPTMLIVGSILLIVCHLTFAFILPMLKGNVAGGYVVAYLSILILGVSFSLIPASIWPSVPAIVDKKVVGSAVAVIFWVQNIGLWGFPMLYGRLLDSQNAPNTPAMEQDHTIPLLMFACLGLASLLMGISLKYVDKKRKLGLENPLYRQ